MQHAEIDEGLREQRVARERDEERAGGDARDAREVARKSDMRGVGQRERHAGRREECGEDRRARAEPETRMLEVAMGDAEIAQVEREVVGDHRHDREPPHDVDGDHATHAPVATSATGAGRGRARAADISGRSARACRDRRNAYRRQARASLRR